jgi:hypothetical protein
MSCVVITGSGGLVGSEAARHFSYSESNRVGDHIWYVSELTKFESHYPEWSVTRDLKSILGEMYEANASSWRVKSIGAR